MYVHYFIHIVLIDALLLSLYILYIKYVVRYLYERSCYCTEYQQRIY